jgi:hypothetical protein
MILSIMIQEWSFKPLLAEGAISSRNSGAPISSADTKQMVTEAVVEKSSDWMITAGRGLPA